MSGDLKLDVLLEEYRNLRAEINQALANSVNIMAFGLATIGIMVGSAVESNNSLISFYLLSVMVPMLSMAILLMWFSEQLRVSRASYYLTGIESRIDAIAGSEVLLNWERWLRKSNSSTRKNRHFFSSGYSGVVVFFLFAFLCPLIGLIGSGKLYEYWAVAITLSCYLILVFFARMFVVMLKKWQTDLNEEFSKD